VAVNDPLHLVSAALTAGAGAGYLWAALRQWQRLGREAASTDGRWWWIAFGLQTLGLAVSLIDPGHRSFAYGALAAWAAVAAVLFAGRYLAAPSRLLMALPLGAVVLLVAIAGVASIGAPPELGTGSWISRLHIAFMAAHLAALVAAGAAGALYLLAAGRLKAGDPLATRLPTLPTLDRLTERGLVWGAALLTGGLGVGGAAIRVSHSFQLLHPTALLGLAEIVLLMAVLAVHSANRLTRRALALAALACLAVAVLGTLSQVVIAHG
jgi:hypothetical protein